MLGKNETYIVDSFWDTIWSRSYRNYEKHHQVFWNLIKQNSKGKVLDLGCGSGSCWVGGMGSIELTGVDFSPVGCTEFARNNPGSRAIVSKIEDLNINETFNTVVLSGVINYYQDLEPIKKQLKRYATDRIIMTINVIKDFEGREWNQELLEKEFGNFGKMETRFYDKIGWFIVIDML